MWDEMNVTIDVAYSQQGFMTSLDLGSSVDAMRETKGTVRMMTKLPEIPCMLDIPDIV